MAPPKERPSASRAAGRALKTGAVFVAATAKTPDPRPPTTSAASLVGVCATRLANLESVMARGRFRFIGPPLKIRGGTASPIRAVAVFE